MAFKPQEQRPMPHDNDRLIAALTLLISTISQRLGKMKRYFLALFFMFSLGASAHQSDISNTMLVEREDGSWLLHVRAALTAFELEVHERFGKDSYSTPEEFRELVIQHLQENLLIRFNDQDETALQNGQVKLGHETNVIFRVADVPETIYTLDVKNSSFKEIHRNQSALIILKSGFEKKHFILNNENQHTAHLAASGNAFIVRPENFDLSTGLPPALYYTGFGGLALTLIAWLAFIKFKNQTSSTKPT